MTRALHPSRLRILAFLRSNPGASMQDIADHLGVHRTAATHHVRVLLQDNQVVAQRQGRRTLHFPAGATKSEHRSLLGYLRQQNVRDLLQAVAANPSISWRRLARELDLTPHTVRWHVQRLEREGVVELHAHPLHGHRIVLPQETRQVLGATAPTPLAEPAVTAWLSRLA